MDLQMIAAAEDIGLSLNLFSKSEISCVNRSVLNRFFNTLAGAKFIHPSKLSLLGGAKLSLLGGDSESISEAISIKTRKLQVVGQRLSLLYTQDAFASSIPKLIYILRSTPCFDLPACYNLNYYTRKQLLCTNQKN